MLHKGEREIASPALPMHIRIELSQGRWLIGDCGSRAGSIEGLRRQGDVWMHRDVVAMEADEGKGARHRLLLRQCHGHL